MAAHRTAEAVVAAALGWVGTPYRHQGRRKGVGCDCLGLVVGVWRELHGSEPERPGPYAPDWAGPGAEDRLMAAARRHCREAGRGAPRDGELVLFAWRRDLPARHCGIMVAPDRFVHAYQGHGVLVSPLVAQWRRRIAGRFAFPEPPSN